jgi:GNAT superfamily N-acetyltransferase
MVLTTSPAGANLSIRPVQPGDAATVAALAGELGYRRSEEETRRWIEQLTALSALAEQHSGLVLTQAVLVACDVSAAGEPVIGWIQIELQRHLQEPERALIAGLVVSEAARSRGVGLILCGAAEEWARAQGVSVVRVTSRSTRERAHRFYLRGGYERVKTSEVFEKKLS